MGHGKSASIVFQTKAARSAVTLSAIAAMCARAVFRRPPRFSGSSAWPFSSNSAPCGRNSFRSRMTDQLKTDILILGTGGAGLMAALHAFWSNPSLDITLVSKGLLGKSGCTRMVQGGYNAVLDRGDSF